MSKKRKRYDEDFKKNAVQLSYASSRSVKEIAADLGITEQLLYRWWKKYKEDGELTETAQLQAEVKRLRLENAELKIQQDMLSKATAYFANLHKNGSDS